MTPYTGHRGTPRQGASELESADYRSGNSMIAVAKQISLPDQDTAILLKSTGTMLRAR